MVKHQYNCPCMECNPNGSVTKELESLNYKPPKCALLNKNGGVLANPEPLDFPEMCKNTKLIVEACKQVVQSAEDHETDTMTTPITVVQACEQLNCLLERLRKEAESSMEKMGFEQLNQNINIMIIEQIEGLMSQVNDKIHSLSYDRLSQDRNLKSKAIEEVDLFQKTTLFELRKEFE